MSYFFLVLRCFNFAGISYCYVGRPCLNVCPGFDQDRIDFHQNPGRGTAGRADPTWPNKAGHSIPCAIMLRSGWEEELGGGISVTAQERAAATGGESFSLCSVLFCVFSLSVSLLSLFLWFAVLLNCPYPNPSVSARFLLFSSAPHWGEGRPRGVFVAGHSQTIKMSC